MRLLRFSLASAVALSVAVRTPLAAAPAAENAAVNFAERYALAADRAAVLAELIPGTEDYYYFHCLHYQNTAQLDKVQPLLAEWAKRFNSPTPGRTTMENRQRLLEYAAKPDDTLRWLQNRLGIVLNHARDAEPGAITLPAGLDNARVSFDAFLTQARSHADLVRQFTPVGQEKLVAMPLAPQHRRDLLNTLASPDLPGLVELVTTELKAPDSPGFSRLALCARLTLDQLEALRTALPDLAADNAYVAAVAKRLSATPGADRASDPAADAAALARLHAFAKTLPPAQNSFKAAILYRVLEEGLTRGPCDPALFLEYIQLPRQQPYVLQTWLREQQSRGIPAANLAADFSAAARLPPVGSDEPLVRTCLEQLLMNADSPAAYAQWLEKDYLARVFAETKLLYGVGDPAVWSAALTPADLQALRNRTEIVFTPDNPQQVAAADAVALTLAVKNVGRLTLRVYDIDAAAWFRQTGEPVTPALNLDGLVANAEKIVDYASFPPLRRHVETLKIAELDRPGTYIVECVGNGISSRALVRKGRLRLVESVTPGGHLFTLLDADGKPRPDASLSFGGRAYPADKDATVLIPFSTEVGAASIDPFAALPMQAKPLVIEAGRVATLARFNHRAESYTLDLDVWLDREQLLADQRATALLRPRLGVSGVPASLALIENPVLELTTTDADGIDAVSRTPLKDLADDAEYGHTFTVPPRTLRLAFVLTGRVRNLSRNADEDLRAEAVIDANGLLVADVPGSGTPGLLTASLHLRRGPAGWSLDVLGRNGEPLAAQTVSLAFSHRCFNQPLRLSLQSGADGRITLGPLADILTLDASLNNGLSASWDLRAAAESAGLLLPETATLGSDQTLRLPGPATPPADTRDVVSLLALADPATPLRDCHDSLRFEPGRLVVGPLPPGDYRLTLKRPLGPAPVAMIELTVTDGPVAAGHRLTPLLALPQTPPEPLQIASATIDGATLRIALGGAADGTRVHLLARRFADGVPAEPFAGFNPFPSPANPFPLAPDRAAYTSGRFIGDEARYVFDRRYAERFPGNLLDRPSLLIAPWSRAETETRTLSARPGDALLLADAAGRGSVAGERKAGGRREMLSRLAGYEAALSATPAYDFLPQSSSLLANLRPAADGTLAVPLQDLAGCAELTVVALSDAGLAWRTVALPESPLAPRDLRLAKTLDPAAATTERKTVRPAAAGEPLALDAATGGDYRVYDTLAQVFRLFQSIAPDPVFETFAFVTEWPTLAPEIKRERYHAFASHELNLLLYRKDRPFFDAVVKPVLANKRDRTFIDRWLLGEDLSAFATWPELARLNTAERVLLAERLPALRAPLATALAQAVEVDRPSPELLDRWFAAAIGSGALEDGATGSELFEMAEQEVAADASRPGAPPAAAMAFGAAEPQMEKAKADRGGADKLESVRGLRARAAAEQLYRSPEKTKEWVETHYYKTPREAMDAGLVTPNAFWLDRARHDPASGKPFLSANLAAAANGATERLLALALLDLPFAAGEHTVTGEGAARAFTPATPAVLFTRQITAAEAAEDAAPVMLVQTCFDPADSVFHTPAGDAVLKPVSEEFLARRAYGARVVVTNPGDQPRRVSLLLQIPAGALPLAGKRPTWSQPLQLDPYESQTVEYSFYFPEAGTFAQCPPSVSEADAFLARAAAQSFNVVAKATRFDTASWDYVSQKGSPEDVLRFLNERNLRRPEVVLSRICWRLRDAALFGKVAAILETRQVFDPAVWSYAFMHRDAARVGAYLRLAADGFTATLGPWLDSPLFRADAEALNRFEHKEYWPLVNARVHPLGDSRVIANASFDSQYRAFADYLAHKPALDGRDRLTLVVCLLMQDRVSDAVRWFKEIRPQDAEMALQADYARAYLAFSQGDPAAAAAIAKRYADLGQNRWRNLFQNILAQAAEAAGAPAAVGDTDSHDQTQHSLADKAPSLALTVEGSRLTITTRNIPAGELRLYPLDIELLFSRQPFISDNAAQSAVIRPAYAAPVTFAANDKPLVLPLPGDFAKKNLLVEIRGGGLSEQRSYTPNTLKVQTVATHGRIRVQGDDGKPAAGAYVKVYARHADGSVRFYKDGYTDLRGWFDYASLSTADLDTARRFALLVLDDARGALLLEAAPPPR